MIIIEIAGHLGADPETRVTSNGLKVTNLRVAVNIRNGEKEETIWWRVTIWGNEFDNMLKHLKKGSAVIVIGEMVRAPEIYEGRVQLQMTARMLKFSPFGKTDRTGQNQQPAQSSSASSGTQGGYYNFGQAESEQSSGQYGGGFSSVGASLHEEADVDAPPF